MLIDVADVWPPHKPWISTRLECALWIGALAAAVSAHDAHLDGELDQLAEKMLRTFRPRSRA